MQFLDVSHTRAKYSCQKKQEKSGREKSTPNLSKKQKKNGNKSEPQEINSKTTELPKISIRAKHSQFNQNHWFVFLYEIFGLPAAGLFCIIFF